MTALPQKVGSYTWIDVSTTCGSGWVGDEYAICHGFWILMADPPATAGGTDIDPSSIPDFEAKPS